MQLCLELLCGLYAFGAVSTCYGFGFYFVWVFGFCCCIGLMDFCVTGEGILIVGVRMMRCVCLNVKCLGYLWISLGWWVSLFYDNVCLMHIVIMGSMDMNSRLLLLLIVV